MTLAEFEKLTKALPPDTRLVISGTSLSDFEQQYDVSEILSAPAWTCGTLAQKAVIIRTVRCEPRFALLQKLTDSPPTKTSER